MPAASLPTLSAIVPNYNHGQYLERSLPAIALQSVQPLELIVLDDASTDNSVEIIQRLAQKYPIIRLVKNDKNLGVMPNLNKGIEMARGHYIFICSADDEVQPLLFEKSLALLAQHPQAAMSCSVSHWHDAASGLSCIWLPGWRTNRGFFRLRRSSRLGREGKLMIVTAASSGKSKLLETGVLS
jgi:glycosyltransferase involved in cell wall biosynthesis